MPRLLAFMACDKVIISQDGNNPTLITVIENINIPIIEPEPDPSTNPATPYRWEVFTLWHWEEGDAGIEYQQRLNLTLPDGRVAINATIDFQHEEGRRTHRNTFRIGGFPIIPQGEYWLRTSIRQAGDDNEWEEVGAYPIYVDRIRTDAN